MNLFTQNVDLFTQTVNMCVQNTFFFSHLGISMNAHFCACNTYFSTLSANLYAKDANLSKQIMIYFTKNVNFRAQNVNFFLVSQY